VRSADPEETRQRVSGRDVAVYCVDSRATGAIGTAVMRKTLALVGLLAFPAGHAATPAAADVDGARAVFSMICIREAQSLGHRDAALRDYVDVCVGAKMKVYLRDMSDPLTAHIPKSC